MLAFMFHCIWLWFKATLGLMFVSIAVVIILLIIDSIINLFDKKE